jgi:hypothetical protein
VSLLSRYSVLHSPLHHRRALQAVTQLARCLRGNEEAVLWCKERVARAEDRAAALVPALLELERAVLAPGHGVDVRLVESLSATMLLLAKVGLPHHPFPQHPCAV